MHLKAVSISLILIFLLITGASAQKFLNEGGVIFKVRWGKLYTGSLTSVELNGGKPYNISNHLSVESEITWLSTDINGVFFTLNNSDGTFASVSYFYKLDKDSSFLHVDFVRDGKEYFLSFSKKEILRYNWIKFRIELDAKAKKFSLRFGEKVLNCSYFKDFGKSLKVTFGLPPLNQSIRNELAYIAVRNITLSTGDLIEHYPLYEVEGVTARDTRSGNYALVKNGVWLNRLRYEPYPEETFMTGSYYLDNGNMFYNNRTLFFDDTLFIFEDKILRLLSLYDMRTGVEKVSTILHPSSTFFRYKNTFGSTYAGTDGEISVFDRGKREWSEIDTTGQYEQHHYGGAVFYNPAADEFWAFGGYGFYTFKNYLRKYLPANGSWEIIPGKTAPQSYRSVSDGMIYYGEDAVWLIGGEGTRDEKVQSRAPYFFSDVLKIGFSDTSLKKAAGFSFPLNDWEALVALPYYEEGEFLILASSRGNNIEQLKRKRLGIFHYDMITGDVRLLSSIKELPYAGASESVYREYYSERIKRGYFSRERDELYFQTGILDSTGQSKLILYVMKTPLMTSSEFEELRQLSGYKPIEYLSTVYYIISGSLALVITGLVLTRYLRRKKREGTVKSEPSGISGKIIKESGPGESLLKTDRSKNFINLFGEFTILDRNGENVAVQMTLKNKQVFLYILIHSILSENGKGGVTSEQLGSTFWSDLPPANVKNNRNVSIKRIREAIAGTDGIELVYLNQHFYFEFGEEFETDLRLLNNIIRKDEFEDFHSEDFSLYLSLLERGRFLEGMSFEWLDYYQDRINNKILLNLNDYFEEILKTRDIPLQMRLASLIMKFDELNEMVFTFIIHLHINQKNIQTAHSTYDRFTKRYREETGNEYPKTFENFIKEERAHNLL